MDCRWEKLGNGVQCAVSREHGFGHDALLLSAFAAPKSRDAAVDLGSGCGVIPLSWFSGGAGPRLAFGADIMPRAVRQMRLGAEKSGLGDKFIPLLADLRQLRLNRPVAQARHPSAEGNDAGALDNSPPRRGAPAGRGGFAPHLGLNAGVDLVTCNPPYQAAGTGGRSKDAAALAARHETLCTLDDVCASAARLLRFGGRFCVCHRPRRLAELFAAMQRVNIEPKRLRTVHKDAASPPWLVLCEGRLGGKPGLSVESPLFTNAGGS